MLNILYISCLLKNKRSLVCKHNGELNLSAVSWFEYLTLPVLISLFAIALVNNNEDDDMIKTDIEKFSVKCISLRTQVSLSSAAASLHYAPVTSHSSV